MRPRTPASAIRALLTGVALVAIASGTSTGQEVAPPSGRIAWVERHERLHITRADGADDRVILETGLPGSLGQVAWSPDGTTLAFAGAQEADCSIWQGDIYTIGADGRGLRRVTNGPACRELAGLATGTIVVTIQNRLESPLDLALHAHGLEIPLGVRVDAGWQITVELPAVHDLGAETPQFVVATDGTSTWFDPEVYADVVPGGSADAGTLIVEGDGLPAWGAYGAAWSPDGGRIAYQQGLDAIWAVDADAPPLAIGAPLLALGSEGFLATSPAWSPTDDRILYQRYDGPESVIGIGTADGDPGGTVLPVTLAWGLDWLADGSGFLVAETEPTLDAANIVRVDLETGAVEKLTGYTDAWATQPAASPDGRWIAYTWSEVAPDLAERTELRLRHVATGVERVLAVDGGSPDWAP